MNKVIIKGRLTADPELKNTASGISACKFTVAVDRKYTKQNGEKEADFISCQAWRSTAEFITKYFRKGNPILVEGMLRTGSYQDRNHSDVTHYTTVVVVDNAEFCESKGAGTTQPAQYQTGAGTTAQPTTPPAQPDYIPTYSSTADFEEILSDGEVPF
jgi:single-strand DNA-binding protein